MNETSLPKLLVVDDEAPLVTALRDTLAQAGYDVTGVNSPREALQRLRQERFELLLTDLEMPEMNGIALLREAILIDAEIVPIVMTGHGTIDTAVEAMKAGALDYILKPFRLRVALPVISRALAVRRLRLENAALQNRLRNYTTALEAANVELEAFSYSVSHDLRAPLRAVEGFASILESELDGPPEALRGYTGRIRSAVDRMNRLIDDLLRLAKVAQAEVHRVPFDLDDLAREVVGKLQEQSPERHVSCTIERGLHVVGDPGLLRIVLENLLSNAWKYTAKTAEAKIAIGMENAEGTSVFYVQDNGVGFDPQFAGRLFTPFQRLHAESEFAGTGVGLATVRRIVHKHGGRIWAEAAPGKGATFRFVIPPAG